MIYPLLPGAHKKERGVGRAAHFLIEEIQMKFTFPALI